jgi:hypothetical protein
MDDASFAKFLGLVEQHYDGTRITWKAIAADMERWWRQRHPAAKKCPYEVKQLRSIFRSSLNALQREKGWIFLRNILLLGSGYTCDSPNSDRMSPSREVDYSESLLLQAW